MNFEIQLNGRLLSVHLTGSALHALHELGTSPLLAEMELYFSCLIRKRVRFHTVAGDQPRVGVTDNLSVSFRPVMTEQCRLESEGDDAVGLAEFPIVKAAAYTPHWLRIDYRRGEWQGEFGYL